MDEEKYPISRYVRAEPSGEWEFIEEFTGTYEQTMQRVFELRQQDKRSDFEVQYRIWDNR